MLANWISTLRSKDISIFLQFKILNELFSLFSQNRHGFEFSLRLSTSDSYMMGIAVGFFNSSLLSMSHGDITTLFII